MFLFRFSYNVPVCHRCTSPFYLADENHTDAQNSDNTVMAKAAFDTLPSMSPFHLLGNLLFLRERPHILH